VKGIIGSGREVGNAVEGIGYMVRRTVVPQLSRPVSHAARSSMLIPFLQALIGAIVWGLANIVYLDMKRKGIRGFTRFAAFWVGTPTTWITLFAVREAKQPTFLVGPEDDGLLLAEIRRDRALRGVPDDGETDGETDGDVPDEQGEVLKTTND